MEPPPAPRSAVGGQKLSAATGQHSHQAPVLQAWHPCCHETPRPGPPGPVSVGDIRPVGQLDRSRERNPNGRAPGRELCPQIPQLRSKHGYPVPHSWLPHRAASTRRGSGLRLSSYPPVTPTHSHQEGLTQDGSSSGRGIGRARWRRRRRARSPGRGGGGNPGHNVGVRPALSSAHLAADRVGAAGVRAAH